MGAHVEWTHGVLRAGGGFDEFGDPYDFVCTVIRRGDEAEMIGAAGQFSKQTYESIKTVLAEEGVTKVHWDRLKPSAKVNFSAVKDTETDKVVVLASRKR